VPFYFINLLHRYCTYLYYCRSPAVQLSSPLSLRRAAPPDPSTVAAQATPPPPAACPPVRAPRDEQAPALVQRQPEGFSEARAGPGPVGSAHLGAVRQRRHVPPRHPAQEIIASVRHYDRTLLVHHHGAGAIEARGRALPVVIPFQPVAALDTRRGAWL